MKKQWTILIVCLVLAAGLGGALWFLLTAENSEMSTDSSSASASESVTLLEKTKDDLDKIEIKNETGEFTVKNLGEGNYTIEGLEQAPLSQPMLTFAANCATSLSANSVVTDQPGNLSDFGLEAPRLTLTAHFTDASTFTLFIGSEAPSNSGVYAKTKDADTVYLLSAYTFNNVLKGKLDFIDKAVTSPPKTEESAQGAQVLPDTVIFGGSARPEEIEVREIDSESEAQKAYGMSVFEMTRPKQRAVDSEDGGNLFSSLLSITASGIAAYQPSDEQLSDYGLTEPYSTVRFTYQDENDAEQSVSIRASAADADGNVFLLREGVPVVYQIAASSLPWYNTQYSDLIATLQLLPFIDDVKTITFEAPGVTHLFALEKNDDELVVTCDGAAVDTDNFRSFYQNLIGVPNEEYTTDTPPAEDTALLRVTYAYHDDARASDTMALLPGVQQRKVFVSINGEAEFYTRDVYVERILSNCDNLIAGKEVADLY